MKFKTPILLCAFGLTMSVHPLTVKAQVTTQLTVLHNFTALNDNEANSDGGYPAGSLIQGSDGNFYGTTFRGGSGGDGTIFKLTPAGALTTLHSFARLNSQSVNSGGAYPYDSLCEGSNHSFYGTTEQGGTEGAGTIFKITSAGTLTTLYNFKGQTGGLPIAGLILGRDGNFYGTANGGGSGGEGVVFKFTPAGEYTDLYNFSGGNGSSPYAGVVQGSDGDFYGTTELGGRYKDPDSAGAGTVFHLADTGEFNVLHYFTTRDDVDFTNVDGADPQAGLIQGTDGNFYGAARYGGNNGAGTIFRVTTAGKFSILHTFSAEEPNGVDGGYTNGDGAFPQSGLIIGRDGNFYGAAQYGGPNEYGTIFQITPAGKLTVLYSFSYDGVADGHLPSALIQAKDGNFYGMTGAGGANGSGTIFKLGIVPTITSPATASATVGKAFTYQIVANADPTSYGVQGLPSGLTVNAKTGLISGTPSASGKFTLTLNAYNGGGKGSATLTLTISGPPVITSTSTASATEGTAFSYRITATNSPTSFGFQGSANGLAINSKTGIISGTPKVAGTFSYTLNAYNSIGKGSATLTLSVKAAAPVITSATTASGTVGTAFTYQITATNSPTTFGFQGNANGLSVNSSTGVISGTPKASGTFTYTLNAYNAAGKGSAALTLKVEGPPVITSSTAVSASIGTAFSYEITATNHPTIYSETGMPTGLKLNAETGVISGTPTAEGSYSVKLGAGNAAGSGFATLTLTVKMAAAPVITSATTATGSVGKAFRYQITATNDPTIYSETGVPTNLELNSDTGVISGTPTATGTYSVKLGAGNAGGSGFTTLTLTVGN